LKHVVNYSGGDASRYTALIVAREHGTADLWLLFADVFVEDRDLYRVLIESAAYLYGLKDDARVRALLLRLGGLPPLSETESRKAFLLALAKDAREVIPRLVWVAEGRTPWDVFKDVRFIGNSRVDPCSRVLKRDFLRAWVEENCDPAETILYFGLDANEGHRLKAVRERHNPHWAFLRLLSYLLFTESNIYFVPPTRAVWRCEAPMVDAFVFKEQARAALDATGVRRSRSYDLGMSHDNCSGCCVKAGQGQWARTLARRPEAYAYAEAEEQQTKRLIGRDDIGVMKDYKTGRATDLKTFREGVESGGFQVDMFEIGGCGCAV
jgi:hypothetical protein